ncbi:MAG TPA: 2-oxo acid dehydrogenase subunit E2, partial [Nannocystis exedens]|nr:2-oxo acid dehydrogenase subunit E2 [Nannocystis exedens]
MTEFRLPEIGEGVVEGEIVQWLKEPGDAIEANEALVEVMTDKATIEVPAPRAGRLVEIRVAVGDICAIDEVIAILEEGGAAVTARPAAATKPAATKPVAVAKPAAAKPAAATSAVAAASSGTVLATPAARALAREKGIDLGGLPATGRGRITKKDVLNASASPSPRAAGSGPTRVTGATGAAYVHAGEPGPGDEIVPFRGMRRRIAESIARSYRTAAHYTYVEQINVSRLVKLRGEAKALAAEHGISLSYLPFIVKAVVHGLKRFPIVNAELDEAGGRVILKKRYDVGIATATEQGLTVPVVRGADSLSIFDIAREIKRLSDQARAGTASRDELTGSTFTITSLGLIGGVLATPILNFPEVGILGVHAIRKTPIVDDNDNIVIG